MKSLTTKKVGISIQYFYTEHLIIDHNTITWLSNCAQCAGNSEQMPRGGSFTRQQVVLFRRHCLLQHLDDALEMRTGFVEALQRQAQPCEHVLVVGRQGWAHRNRLRHDLVEDGDI